MVRKKDENEIAYNTLHKLLNRDKKRDGLFVATDIEDEKMLCRVEAGRKGGKAKNKLPKKQRSKIAQNAANIRWKSD